MITLQIHDSLGYQKRNRFGSQSLLRCRPKFSRARHVSSTVSQRDGEAKVFSTAFGLKCRR
jgi:hypothetical protein